MENQVSTENNNRLVFYSSITGGIIGATIPLYTGWQIGDYIANSFEFGTMAKYTTKSISSATLTALVGVKSVSLGFIFGAIASDEIGDATKKIKYSLEQLLTKK